MTCSDQSQGRNCTTWQTGAEDAHDKDSSEPGDSNINLIAVSGERGCRQRIGNVVARGKNIEAVVSECPHLPAIY